MNDSALSKRLLLLLGITLLAAAFVYGRPLLSGDDGEDETAEVPPDLGFVDEAIESEPAPWQLPATPRNPFVQVDLDLPAAPDSADTDEAGEAG